MSWEKAKIVEICCGIYDGPHATPPVSEDGAIFLGISNITPDGHLDLSDPKYISENDLPKWTKRVAPQAGDIVFSYEATLNLYAMIPEGFRGCLGRRMALIRPDEEKVLGRYLYYYFFSDEWRATIAENTVIGATVDRIPLIRFPEFPVSFPSLEKQRTIADTLSVYDDLIENNQNQIKLLEEAAQRLYKEWFVDLRFPGHETTPIVDGVPEGWRKDELKHIALLKAGGDRPKIFSKERTDQCTVPVFSNGTENEGLYGYTDKAEIEDSCVTISARGSVGYTCLRKVGFVPIVRLIAAIPIAIDVEYLFFCLKNMTIDSNGAAQQQITVPMIKNKQIVLPSDDILKMFICEVRPIMNLRENLKLQMLKLIEARNRLLPKLMSGEMKI